MIKFFRRIRQKLIDEGNLRKYTIYAIGEILLVMVGILLALQVNNWNNQKIQNEHERKILKEIHSSLQQDSTRIRSSLLQVNKMFTANDSIIKFINSEDVDISKIGGYLHETSIHLSIEFHVSAYESLKSKGFDIISNDSVRIAISDVYDFMYPFTHKSMNNYNIHLRDHWRPYMINNFLFKVDSITSFQVERHPINLEDFKLEPKVENILILNRFLLSVQKTVVGTLLSEVTIVLNSIDDYLKEK